MNNTPFRKIIPHLIAYFIFVLISFAFFSPYILENKTLTQSDNTRAYGMQAESYKVFKETGDWPLWTNSQFSGMPAYQIKGSYDNNMNKYFYKVLLLFHGIVDVPYVVLMAMFCCYLFLVLMGVDWRIGIIGSIAYGLSTYFCDIAEAGHSTKMVVMALVPGIFAGAVLAYRKKYLIGGMLFGIFLSIGILANHVQIIFYTFLLLLILGVVEGIKAVRNNSLPVFAKASGVLVIAGLLAVLSNLSMLWTTYEYSKETIRGKSELSTNAAKGDGLDKDYIWQWSYGIKESMTLLVHNFNGGGASQDMSSTNTYKRLAPGQIQQLVQQGYSPEAAKKAARQSTASVFYWGDQPFVGTAIYFGAVILLFFFMGLFIVKGSIKWWLAIAAFFSLSIAWGGNFFLNHLLVDYFPMFNKFRAVSMALGLSHLCVVALAALALQEVINTKRTVAERQKALYWALGISGGLALVALLMSGTAHLGNPAKDGRLPANILDMVRADRASMMRSDALKSLAFILLSGGLLWAYLKGKIKTIVLLGAIGLLVLVDTWTAARRIIYADKYEAKVENPRERKPTGVDKQILDSEKDIHYRVLDLSRGNPFTSTEASYFHKSLGGYHAAKLMRYQELIERYLSKPVENKHIIGMLNGKYIIQDQGGRGQAVPVAEALGNAWFVNSYKVVENGDAEIAALASLKPKEEAVIQKDYAGTLQGLKIQPDPNAYIRLTSYHPDKMTYEYKAGTEQFAVFSEIYYPPAKGWKLLLDGAEPLEIFKVNYLLRGARLPAGQHTLEMRFEPRSFYLGETVSLISSILLLFAFLGALFFYFKNNGLPEASKIEEELISDNTSKMPEKVSPTKSKTAKKKGKKKR